LEFVFAPPISFACYAGDLIMSMSVHDALEAWQAGEITARRAIALTGAEGLLDLYALAAECGVAIRTVPTSAERAAADAAVAAIRRVASLPEDAGHPHAA